MDLLLHDHKTELAIFHHNLEKKLEPKYLVSHWLNQAALSSVTLPIRYGQGARVTWKKWRRACHSAGALCDSFHHNETRDLPSRWRCPAQEKHQESTISIITDNYHFPLGDQSHCVYRRNEQHGRCHFSFCPSNCVLTDVWWHFQS